MNDFLWEFMESELAMRRWYIGSNDKPAFFAIDSMVKKAHYDLMLNMVGRIGTYKTLKKLTDAVRELVENANVPIQVYMKCRSDKRIFFAENNTNRIDSKAKGFIKVFNLPKEVIL